MVGLVVVVFQKKVSQKIYHCDCMRGRTEKLNLWEVLVRRLGAMFNKWTHPSLVKNVFWFYSCQVPEQGGVNDGWIEHCSQSYTDKGQNNKQVGQNVKNAEKGAKHGHLRVTVGQGNGGRGAVVYDDELLSASQGVWSRRVLWRWRAELIVDGRGRRCDWWCQSQLWGREKRTRSLRKMLQ